MSSCLICSKDNCPYKCPKCRMSYCSIVCCNIHKENGCTKPVFNISEERKEGSSSETYSHITDDTIPLNKLQRLGDNEELKNILSNKHLRDIITELDSCNNPNQMLEMAMKEPIFSEFVDACLQNCVEHVDKCVDNK